MEMLEHFCPYPALTGCMTFVYTDLGHPKPLHVACIFTIYSLCAMAGRMLRHFLSKVAIVAGS